LRRRRESIQPAELGDPTESPAKLLVILAISLTIPDESRRFSGRALCLLSGNKKQRNRYIDANGLVRIGAVTAFLTTEQGGTVQPAPPHDR
jgi:hypothetical protein